MNGFVKFGLIAAGAFIIYEVWSKWSVQAAAASTVTPATSTAANSITSNAVNAAASKIDTNTEQQMVVAAALTGKPQQNGTVTANAWEWDYFYRKVKGITDSSVGFSGLFKSPADPITVSQYAATVNGLSTLGLGAILPQQVPARNHYGALELWNAVARIQ